MTLPTPPGGRGLLDGKVVLVTAAAGTGIGQATARRCLEEGAVVVLSDAHERRLADAADLMEEAFNKSPELRQKYAHQVKLWRCGISM